MRSNLKKAFAVGLLAVVAFGAYAALAPSEALACSCPTWCSPFCELLGLDCVCGGPCDCCECVWTS